MANLQIKGMDDNLYEQIKAVAASENRSLSQQILFLVKSYMAKKDSFESEVSGARMLLSLSDSWEDERGAEEILAEIRKARKNSRKLGKGF